MAEDSETCPEENRLQALMHGALPEALAADLESHLGACASCRAALEELSGVGTFEGSDLTAVLDAGSQREVEALAEVLKESSSFGGPARREDPVQAPPHAGLPDGVAGQVIGGYEVLEEIARGGMGVVLKAWDPNLQRAVAIKKLAPHLAADASARERFICEARAAAALDHENILPIYAVEPDPDAPYLVMPFVEGLSLQQAIDEAGGPLSSEELTAIGAKIAAGLEFAHKNGVIHRDLKPANILLDAERRRVWIADFGLARVGDHSGLTLSGVLAGTPSFMAPEQIDDQPVDHRADLYAFGVTLYAMATGKAPFEGSSVAALLRQVVESPAPPAQSINEQLDPALDRIIGKLLEKDPDQRFQSAEEVRHALKGGESASAMAKEPQADDRTKPRRPVLVAAMTALAVAITAWVASSLWPEKPPVFSPPASAGGPFVISRAGEDDNDAASFPSLSAALAQCEDGDVIEVRLNGAHTLEPVEFTDKNVIVRAGDSHHPVFGITDNSKPAITMHGGRLWLEGLDFGRDSAPGVDYPMISVRDASALWISNCRLAVDSGAEMTAPPPPVVQFENTADFLLVNSSIVSQRFTMLGSVNTNPLEEQRLEIRNSALLGLWIMSFAHPGSSKGEVALHRNLLVGRLLFNSLGNQRIRNFSFAAEQNIFDARQAILSIEKGGLRLPNDPAGFRWRGQDNIFHSGFAYVQGMRGLRRVSGARSFEDWKTVTEREERSVEAEVIDRDHMFRPGGLRISDIELDQVVLALGKEREDLPDAGPNLGLVGPGEAWWKWRESAEGKEWRTTQLKRWREGE